MSARELDQGATVAVLALAVLLLARPVIGGLLLALGRLPGRVGRACDALGAAVAPAVVRRLLAGTAGLAVGVLPTMVSAQAGATTLVAADAGPAAPAAGWVLDRVARAPAPAPDSRVPTIDRAPLPASPATRSRPPSGTHRVAPGECLWQLAAAQLGPGADDASVDSQWRRWYRLNRSVIGSDPDVLVPGQVLRIPGTTR